jgi:hypothetical protein
MLPNCTKSKTARGRISLTGHALPQPDGALGNVYNKRNVYNKGTGFSTWFPG